MLDIILISLKEVLKLKNKGLPLILIFSLSVSFASDEGDNLKFNNESGDLDSQIDDEISVVDVPQEDEDSGIDDSQGSQLGATDEDNLELKPGEGTFAQLDTLVTNNRVVNLDKDYVRNGYKHTSSSSTTYYITLSRAISIDGHGHTLDGEGYGPIFSIRTHERITFKNIIFTNVTSSSVITSVYVHDGQVDFENCTFVNVGGGISLTPYYGTNIRVQAIFKDLKFINCTNPRAYMIYSSLSLYANFDNVTIINADKAASTNPDYSGAIRSTAYFNGTFNNVKIINCNGALGGGMHFEGECHANFTDVEFINNTATRGGAAIYTTTDIDGVFKNVKFINNRVTDTYYGGAIHSTKVLSSRFENVEFINNSATYYGGAIYANSLKSRFDDVIFKGNTVYNSCGGAIYSQKDFNCTFHNVSFIDNHIVSRSSSDMCYGGAIASYQTIEAHFIDVKFENNTAYSDNTYYGYGGAIYMTNGLADFVNVNFTNNEALIGGAIYHSSLSSISFVDVNFNSNKARYNLNTKGNGGGALYLTGTGVNRAVADLKRTTFVNNSAVNFGGAISASSLGLRIDDTVFENNTAGREGGVIATKAPINLTNSNFTGNSAPEGSAIVINDYYSVVVHVDGCNFIKNKGKVIDTFYNYQSGSDMIISNSNFDSNDGDSIVSKFNTNVTNCNFTNNNGRAMLFKVYDYATSPLFDRRNYVDRVVCINNTADTGSAILNWGTTVHISNSVFLKNKAGSTSMEIDYDKFRHVINVEYFSGNNFINAIDSSGYVFFSNVTYFNYLGIVNSDDVAPVESYGPTNSSILIEVYDDETHIAQAFNITCEGETTLYAYKTPIIHHIVASHVDDDYYEGISGEYRYLWGDFDELQRLVILTPEGGTLDLPRNFTYIIDLDTITEGIFINKTMTINGNGYTINALNQSRIFKLESDDITLSNIRFVNANGINGSFIYGDNVNNTKIDECIFDNFNASAEVQLTYYGGAISLSGNNALISNSKFMNLAAEYGGAIYFNGTQFTIYNSEFTDCHAIFGGAVYVDEGALDNTIDHSTFINCNATYSGGAVFWNAQDGKIKDSTYEGNSIERLAEYYEEGPLPVNGGGAVLWNANNGLITGSNFTNNRAIVDELQRFSDRLYGGAVLIYSLNTNISASTFRQNYAQSGGAVAIMNMTYTPVHPKYIKTTEELESLGGFNSNIIGSTFIDNFAQYGGAVMLKSYKNSIIKSEFYNNTAYLGGAVILEGMNGTINASLFDNNVAHLGGAVVSGFNCIFYEESWQYDSETGDYIQVITPRPVYSGDYNTIADSQFTDNHADSAGAVLWVDENGLIEDNTLFKSNSACDSFARYSGSFERCYGEEISQGEYEDVPTNPDSGVMGLVEGLKHKDFAGALYWIGKGGLVNNVEFVENTAVNGGAMLQEVASVLINASRFIKNHAENGGALWSNNNSYISYSNFSQNNATLGGAVYWNGSNSQIDNSQFVDNLAHFGGAIFVTGEFNTLMNSELKFNKAVYGSAIHLDARGLSIISTTLLENQANSTSLLVKLNTTDVAIVVDATLVGGDNLMNAIYTLSSNYHLSDVTYWRVEGIVNSDDLIPAITDLESGQNITVELYSHNTTDNPVTVTNITDNNGHTRIVIPIHYGRYIVLTSHKEDNYYRAINDTSVMEFELLDPVMSIAADEIYYKENATVFVSCRDTATGNITLFVEGQNYSTVELVNGHAYFNVENLVGGSHNFTAYYSGDENYNPGSIHMMFTVMPIPSHINVTSPGGKYKEPISFHVEIGPEEITGEVIITIKNEYGEAVSINDVRSFTHIINNLTAGKHNITVYYEGSNNYMPSSNYTVFEVAPIDLPANAYANPEEIPSSHNTTFSIEVPNDFDGQVRITVGDKSRIYNVTGSTVLIFDKLFLGDKVATIDFFGDKDYNNLTLTAPFKIVRPGGSESFGTVNADNMTRGLNSPYDYQAAFLDYDGNVLINIDVAFIVNGKEYRAVTNKDGIAQLTASHLPIGVYDIKSINLLTGEESTRKLSIVKRISDNKDVTTDFASGEYFTVKVWGDDGKLAPEGEFVSMSIGVNHYVCRIDANGIAKLKITFNPKKYTVITEYKGYKVTNKIVVKQTLKLVKKTVKAKKGKKLVLKAKLKWSSGKPIKGKVIKFKFRGKTYKVKTTSKGIAKVTIKKKVTKKLKKGKKYKFTASYLKNTVKGKVKVKK